MTFSLEDDEENLKKLLPLLPVESCLTVYQDAPLFLSAHCLQNKPCSLCRGEESFSWIKKSGDILRVYTKDCLTTVTKKQPFLLPKDVLNWPVEYFRIDFINRPYTTKEMSDVLDIFLPDETAKDKVETFSGKKESSQTTGYVGNFKRGLD